MHNEILFYGEAVLLVVTAAEHSAGSHCHLLGCSRASRDPAGIKRLTRRMSAAPSAWQGPPRPQNRWGFCVRGAAALCSARWGSPGGSVGAQGDVGRRTAHPLRGSPPARGSSRSPLPAPHSGTAAVPASAPRVSFPLGWCHRRGFTWELGIPPLSF